MNLVYIAESNNSFHFRELLQFVKANDDIAREIAER